MKHCVALHESGYSGWLYLLGCPLGSIALIVLLAMSSSAAGHGQPLRTQAPPIPTAILADFPPVKAFALTADASANTPRSDPKRLSS